MVELRTIIIAFAILIGFFVSSYLINFILFIIKKIVSKTKTTLDDEIIKSLYKPIRFLSVILGAFFAIYYIERDLTIDGIAVTDILFSLIVLWITYTLSRLVSTSLKWYSKEISPKTQSKLDDHLFPFVRKVIAVVLFVIALVIILDRFGVQIGPLIAGLGVAGLAVALALQDTLSNFFAGIHILGDKPIRVGDFIKLESGQEGFVREIGWRSIRIETLSGDFVIIPNSKISQSTIINYSLPQSKERVLIPIGIDYSSDVELAEKTMVQSVKNVAKDGEFGRQYISKEFANNNMAITIFKGFGESSLDFLLIYEITDYSKRGLVTTEINKEVLRQFRKHKVEIPYPIRTIIQKK